MARFLFLHRESAKSDGVSSPDWLNLSFLSNRPIDRVCLVSLLSRSFLLFAALRYWEVWSIQ